MVNSKCSFILTSKSVWITILTRGKATEIAMSSHQQNVAGNNFSMYLD